MSGERSWWQWFSGIALVRFFLMGILTLLAYALAQIAIFGGATKLPLEYRAAGEVALALVCALILVAIYRYLVLWFERRRADEIEFSLPQLIAGLVVAVLLYCGIFAIYYGLHDVAIPTYAGTSGLGAMLALSIISGAGEEIVFRGVLFRVTEEAGGTLLALLVSGAIFGALHGGNPHATWFSSLAIAIEAGILLGAAYAATRNLWLAIGIHSGWNFMEAGVFGWADSGTKSQGLLNAPLHGPEILTGGAFGPEASIVAMGACSLLTLLFLIAIVRRGEWVGLHWSWRGGVA